jgi:alcohol dehydrogenase (cytochrome c)
MGGYVKQNISIPIGILIAAYFGLSTACTPAANSNISHATPTVTPARAQTEAVADGDWAGYNRTLTGERYSPLDQITTANVATLKQACTFDLGEAGNFQSGIITVNNMLYVTTDSNTFAVDPATCQQKWKHHYDKPTPQGLRVNRGVAYADGKIFRGVNTGYMMALDANTGQFLWETKMADPTKGESVPAAPIAWNGMVFIGQAGGDNKGVRGRMMAFSQADGKQLWSFDLVPLSGTGSDSWPTSTEENPRTGGATWTSYTLDPATGLLYVPAGNAAPDFDIKARPGLNLYTNSLVILDARTGEFREYYQLTPNDFHDWDVAAAPALIQTAGGKNLIVAGGKDGILHAVDASQKTEIYKTPVTTIENIDMALSEDKMTHFCPGVQGGVEWNGPAFNPTANLIFVNSIDWCYSLKLFPPNSKGEAGKPFSGGTSSDEPFGTVDPKEKWKGYVTAVNADDGTVKWKYESPTPMIAGITTTAGGIVFTGDLDGNALAFDAADGTLLWKQNTGSPIGGGVISYLAGGKQYLAVATGLASQSWQTKAGSAKVAVYAIP